MSRLGLRSHLGGTRAGVVVLALAVVALAPPLSRAQDPPATPLTDIQGNFFQAEIEWIYNARITTGCVPDVEFCPTGVVSREQMASFLVRALHLPPSDLDHFVDDDDSFHEGDINRLAEAGITTGCGTDEVEGSPTFGNPIYCPTQLMTREQMASFLVRAVGLTFAGQDYFDDDELSVSHEADINRLRESGITTGCDPAQPRLYCPTASVLREQMAAFIFRALRGADLEPLPEDFPTVASGVAHHFGGTQEIEIPPDCGGDPTINCPGGNPTPGPGVTLTGVTTGAESNVDGTYAFSATASLTSDQIPFQTRDLECDFEVDTARGAESTAEFAGTMRFASQYPSGPLNRLDIATITLNGIENDDITITGGFECNFAGTFTGSLIGVLTDILEDRFRDQRLCGPAGEGLFVSCPDPFVGSFAETS